MDDWEQMVLLMVLAVGLLAVWALGKRRAGQGRAARLMKKYASISGEAFGSIPEDELVEAVVSRVLAKAAAQRAADLERTLAVLPHGNTVVYSVWAVCKELAGSSYAMLTTTATRALVEPAREGLQTIGAPACAAALEELRVAYKAGNRDGEAEAAFHRAVEKECPLTLCIDYIRDHKDDFLDE